MRTSKYIGFQSGAWVCTEVAVARVQPVFRAKRNKLGNRIRNKYPGHQTYNYIFERYTSDGKAIKIVSLNAKQAYQVYCGKLTVEEIADKRHTQKATSFKDRVSYSFCDRI